MRFDQSRLRIGEVVAGAAGIALAASMFLAPWYGAGSATVTGWHGLTHVRWLLVLTIIIALALAYFQATRPAPAIPVSLSVIVTSLGALSALALIYRVLINVPGPAAETARVGAYFGLASALAMVIGGVLSMRQEGIAPHDAPAEIPIVRAGGAG